MIGETLLFGMVVFCGLFVLLAMAVSHAKRDVNIDITFVEFYP